VWTALLTQGRISHFESEIGHSAMYVWVFTLTFHIVEIRGLPPDINILWTWRHFVVKIHFFSLPIWGEQQKPTIGKVISNSICCLSL
jgi:hypothetical protein